jgi:2-oxoisovalerate dehydrogenase E1 component
VLDLRWLAPLPEQALLDAVKHCARILIVDECRRTGSQSEALMAFFDEHAPEKICRRIAADDSFIPLGKAATVTMPSRDSIVAAALETVRG